MNQSSEPLYILSTAGFSDELLARVRAVSDRIVLAQHPTFNPAQVPAEEFARAEILYTFRALPQPPQAPRLKWVQLNSAGANHILDHPLFKAGVTFTTTSGLHAINIAEYVLASILAWSRQFHVLFDYKRRAVWPGDERWTRFVPRELRGATLGVVGYGSIGREVSRLACALGMTVLALKRQPQRRDDPGFSFVGDAEGCLPQVIYGPDQLLQMLPLCDYVVLAVPLNAETRHMLSERELRAMRPTAYLVNIARGEVVDEAALVRALQEGWIAGAGLDVFEQEPLPADSPLWKLDNVILTPHISGLTPHYDERAIEIFVENLRRYIGGQPLLNVVDAALGY
jgi:phosphoglycerate dehydrogenase-like enzyme